MVEVAQIHILKMSQMVGEANQQAFQDGQGSEYQKS